jgi:hypothetical protein
LEKKPTMRAIVTSPARAAALLMTVVNAKNQLSPK